MNIEVLLDGTSVSVDRDVFTEILGNSAAGTYVAYGHALENGVIKYPDLVRLARQGEIPYSLFFAPLPVVQEQVRMKTKKLLAGVSRQTFQVGSRAKVELRDVELIVKDLIRKQELLKRHDKSLTRNRVIGALRAQNTGSPEADAQQLMNLLDLRHSDMLSCRTKEKALELLIGRLEANQVLVSRSVQNYMPQRLAGVRFSGMTIRDSRVPFIFLAGGDHGDDQEPVGRTIFTLALMAVLVARRVFAPVTWDATSASINLGSEYDTAAAMLMPEKEFREIRPCSLGEVRAAAERFKVTPSAVTVRAMRLGIIDTEAATGYLDELRAEFVALPKKRARSPIRPENAVRKYAGAELSRRMLRALDARSIAPREFCRTVCLNHLRPEQIGDLRRVLG